MIARGFFSCETEARFSWACILLVTWQWRQCKRLTDGVWLVNVMDRDTNLAAWNASIRSPPPEKESSTTKPELHDGRRETRRKCRRNATGNEIEKLWTSQVVRDGSIWRVRDLNKALRKLFYSLLLFEYKWLLLWAFTNLTILYQRFYR
jgi:hypothetical protein